MTNTELNKILYWLKDMYKKQTLNLSNLKEIIEKVHNSFKISENRLIEETLRELVYDLDFFEPDLQKRNEDSVFISEERALQLIHSALNKIGLIGD